MDIKGHLHADEHEVIRGLMTHLATHAGIQLSEASGDSGRKPGSWTWLAASDPAAPPGRSRLFLRDLGEVHQVRAQLHDKSIKIGLDTFRIQVHNDLVDKAQGGAAAQ